MLSTYKDVTAHVGAWIVVNMRPATRSVGDLNWWAGTRHPRAGCPLCSRLATEGAMSDDRATKLFAGQLGIVAVLVNVFLRSDK